jgi:hypothetical protein
MTAETVSRKLTSQVAIWDAIAAKARGKAGLGGFRLALRLCAALRDHRKGEADGE